MVDFFAGLRICHRLFVPVGVAVDHLLMCNFAMAEVSDLMRSYAKPEPESIAVRESQ